MNLDKVTQHRFPDTRADYTAKDSILYALGVGFASEPLDSQHLQYLYEGHDAGLIASPTLANVLGHPGMWARDAEYAIDWKKLLHAEQRLTLHRHLPASGEIIGEHSITGVQDKGAGAGAMLFQRKQVLDAATREPIASVLTTLMLRGDGGCGSWGVVPEALAALPEGEPERSLEVQTLEIAPLIYRLSGDLNPLHIDPAVATHAGFPRPILHGLATKGFAGYALLRSYCSFDASRLKSMALRFSRPVLPGDRIHFDFWQPQPGLVRFRAVVAERNETVLDRGTAEIA